LGFVDPRPAEGLAYWRLKGCGQRLPARRDIDPVDIPRLLPYVGLVEFRLEGAGISQIRLRLMGEEWQQVFGSIHGKYLMDVLPYPIAERWARIIGTVARTREPTRFLGAVGHEYKHHLLAEVLVAPLSSTGCDVDGVFAVGVFNSNYCELRRRGT
jgi:hypothetical protein